MRACQGSLWGQGKVAADTSVNTGLCRALQVYNKQPPTNDDLSDAAYELGDGDGQQNGWGRVTLTDK